MPRGRGGAEARTSITSMKSVEEHAEIKASAPEKGEEPSRFRKYTSLSAMKAGDGSFRGLFSLSKTTEKSAYHGPSMREVGPQYYLREEIRAAREAVNTLDRAVSGAQSFREKATTLLEEAHRAMGRLEQAVAYRDGAPELIVVACEIKCAARRGITLVDVYGKYSTMIKIMTLFMRSYIHSKFDKQCDHLKSLIPQAELRSAGAAAAGAGAAGAGISVAGMPQSLPAAIPGGPNTLLGASQGPLSPLPSLPSSPPCSTGAASSHPSTVPSMTPAQQAALNQQPTQASIGTSLNRSSTSHPTNAAGSSAPQQPLVGTMLRPNKHDRVYAIAYVPPAQASSEYVCIWWSAGQMLEFYSEATQSTTGFQIEKPSLNVTALGIDEDGNVWTGHAKGLVRVRPKQQWEFMVEDKAFSSAVKAITFDEAGNAWIGDDSGRIKVLGYDPRAGKLETLVSLQRSPALLAKMKGALADTTRGLFGKRHCPNSSSSGQSSAAAVFAAASAAAAAAAAEAQSIAQAITAPRGKEGPASSSSGHNPPVAIEGPVRCIFLRGGRAWTSGGKASGWLQLWDATSYEDLDVYDCCNFGPCNAMASVRWPAPTSSAASSLHPNSIHRRTPSDGARQPGALGGAFDGSVASGAGGGGTGGCSWRLLTGHENGQLLMWHPEHRGLAPLLRIGETGSPCRGIAAFDAYRLVATGHQNGELRLFVQPTAEAGLPPGSESVAPQSFGTLRPRMVTIQAHKSRVDRMTFSGTSCVTASWLGTIRLWHAADLAAEAHRHGLLAHTPSYNSLATAGNGSSMAAVPSLQTLGTRYSTSTSMGDLSTPLYTSVREPGKRIGTAADLQQSASAGIIGSPPITGGLFGSPQVGTVFGSPPVVTLTSANLAGASTISTNLSTLLSQASHASGPQLQLQQLQMQQLQQMQLQQAQQGQQQAGLLQQQAGLQQLQLPPMQQQQQQQLQAVAQQLAGGPVSAGHHVRQGSKDSSDTVGGSITQPSSTGTQITEAAGGSTISQQAPQGLSGGSAVFPHFQTIDSSELSMKKLIGSGAYGKVWLADWMGCQVAVKELYGLAGGRTSTDGKEYSAMMNEVTLLGSLSHPNIMRFLAMCLEPPLIVMQYYPHGSLFDLLHKANKGSVKAAKELAWGKRLDMLRDVAAGMQYLHSRKPPVIHGDLRSPNLLLDLTIDHDRPRFHVKIADFGLARMATGANGSVMVSKTTNPRWLAPEVIKNSSVGKAADVYSFAIIMWEMLTWQQPYEDMMSVQVMFSTVTENSRPDVPPDGQLPGTPGVSLHLYRQLMESCWNADASQRPSFKEVVECFQGMQRVETEAAKQQRAAGGGSVASRRSRPPSETGFTMATGGANGTVAPGPPEGPVSGNAPGSGGSAGNGAAAIAAAAALAGGRRAQGPSVPSPFQGAPSPFAGSSPVGGSEADTGGGAWYAGGALSPDTSLSPPQQPSQQYGSSLPFYGMSPILEEQLSSATAAAAADGGASGASSAAPGAPGASPFAAAAAAGGGRGQEQQAVQSPFATRPGPPPGNLQHRQAGLAGPQQHQHHQLHVHFAPSAFAQAAAEVDTAGTAFDPPSPRGGGSGSVQRSIEVHGGARGHTPSSASSTESGIAAQAAASGGNAYSSLGGPSNASSRQSSASTSGRAIGAAAAAAAAAVAGGAAGTNTAGGSGRKPAGGATGRGAVGGGSGTVTPRREPSGASARGVSRRAGLGATTSAADTSPAGDAGPARAAGATPLWEAASVPTAAGAANLSPFSSLPASQLGEPDASSAPQLDAAAVPHAAPAASGAGGVASPFANAAPSHLDGSRTSAGHTGRAGGAAPLRMANGRPASGSSGAVGLAGSMGVSSRGRIPGPSFGPGPSSRTGPMAGSGHGGAPRGAGATHSQPGTPPYRGAPASPMTARGAGGPGMRTASITGQSGGSSAVNSAAQGPVQRSQSGDGPSQAGSRTASITGAPPDTRHFAGAGVGAAAEQAPRAGRRGTTGRRQSYSAVHGHYESLVDVAGQIDAGGVAAGAGAGGTGPGGRPTHRRTPSGGSVPVAAFGGGGAISGRTRDLAAAAGTGPVHTHREVGSPASSYMTQPRTPNASSRSGRASPRVSTPNSGADSARSTAASRRAGAAAATTPVAVAGSTASPSITSVGHLSRLGAAANARPPASPRSYLPGGPGSISAHAHPPSSSRIPSVSQGSGSTPGPPGAPPPAKSSTSRSLDDLSMHRSGQGQAQAQGQGGGAATASPSAAVAVAAAVRAGHAAPCSPFAMAAAGWDDGLGLRHSPDATSEVIQERDSGFNRSGEYLHTRNEGEEEGGGEAGAHGHGAAFGAAGLEGLPAPPAHDHAGVPSRAAQQQQQQQHLQPAQPPALRNAAGASHSPFANTAGGSPFAAAAGNSPFAAAAGGSPFAAAAYTSPFHEASQMEEEGQGQEGYGRHEAGSSATAQRPAPAPAPPAQAAARSPFAGCQDGW